MPLIKSKKHNQPHTPSGLKPKMDWFFVAFFDDNTQVIQDQDDAAKLSEDGSAFTDVMTKIKGGAKLLAFELRQQSRPKHVVTLDMITGVFIINGLVLATHNQYFEPEKYPLEIVYFRETRAQQDIKATVQKDMSVKQEKIGEPRVFINRYFIGWQTTVHGENKQHTIAVG